MLDMNAHGEMENIKTTIPYQEIFLLSAIEHNNIFITYITAACFGLFYRPLSGSTLRNTHVRIPRNVIYAWACSCVYMHIALLIQHATRMHHVVKSFVAPKSTPSFSTLSHK